MESKLSMDFMSDALMTSRRFRMFNVVDDFNREALVIENILNLPALRIICVMERVVQQRGYFGKQKLSNGMVVKRVRLHIIML